MELRIRTSAVIIHNDKILCFWGVDPHDQRGFHFLPGGKIESGETATDAVVRETFEETGYSIRVETESAVDKDYVFRWDGKEVNCHTIFYRAFLTNPFQSPKPVKDAAYNMGVRWVPLEDLQETFKYSAEILAAVQTLSKIR